MLDFKNIIHWSKWSAEDDDDTSSRDPLALETFAEYLSEQILPAMTTLTWRPRYITIICQWLDFIERVLKLTDIDKKLHLIKQLEKLTAYSIVSAFQRELTNGSENSNDNLTRLIGIRYAVAYLNKKPQWFSLKQRNYLFLVNQGASGAFASYKKLLASLGLIDEQEISITESGKEFIRGITFPHGSEQFIKRALNEEVEASSKYFITLGRFWGLSSFYSDGEKMSLKDLIFANPQRMATLLLLKGKNGWSIDEILKATKVDATNKAVLDVFGYIYRFEIVNRAIHFLFYSLLAGADRVDINRVVKSEGVIDAIKVINGKAMSDYLTYHSSNEAIFTDLKGILSSPYEFFSELYNLDGVGIFESLLRHHHENQRRKGKVPWISLPKDGFCTVILHKYKIYDNPYSDSESMVFNYRLNNAWRFIDDLSI